MKRRKLRKPARVGRLSLDEAAEAVHRVKENHVKEQQIKLGLDRLPAEQERFWVVEFSNCLGKYVSHQCGDFLVPILYGSRKNAREEARRWRGIGTRVRVGRVKLIDIVRR